MVKTYITDKEAAERGTFVVDFTFKDEDGALVTPHSGLAWTLTDEQGTVVNSRSAVPITPGTTVSVVLSGADLALGSPYIGRARCLLIEGTYDSDLGLNLPLKDEAIFNIADFAGVS